jgi:hypothetical protein
MAYLCVLYNIELGKYGGLFSLALARLILERRIQCLCAFSKKRLILDVVIFNNSEFYG